MEPTYRNGDILIGKRFGMLNIGSVVVVQRELLLVKRLVRIESDGYWIEGDNPERSTDSRTFGWVDRNDVVAIVLFRIPIA